MATFMILFFASFFFFEIESYYLPLAGLKLNYVDQDLRLTKVPLPHQCWCKRHIDICYLVFDFFCVCDKVSVFCSGWPRACYVAQTGLKFKFYLLQLTWCWNCRHEPLYLASK